MSKPVVITADSPVDLSAEVAAQYSIKMIPLHIMLDGKAYHDGIDIKAPDLYKYYAENKVLPTTSAISIAEYSDFFSVLLEEGYEVVHLCLSSSISSTYQNATIAAQDLDGVYVVDTKSLSSGMALLALLACEKRDEGLNAKEIFGEIIAGVPKVRVSFVLDTLVFMSKGGRCSAVAAFGANILGIRPSIDMKDGALNIAKKYRGRTETVQLQYAADRLRSDAEIDTMRAFLVHTGLERSQLDSLRREILKIVPFKELPEAIASCTIGTHCGPNCMGIMYMTK